MIRVLQIGMTDNLGGIENYLINYYRNIDKTKVQFDFINIYPNDLCFQDEIKELGGRVYKISNYYRHPIKYIKELKEIIRKNNYEIIHCNMNSAVMLYPLIAAKLAKAKIIIAHSHNSYSDKGFLKSLLHNINRHFIPVFANTFFACSDFAGEWFFSKKVTREKLYIINNAIDLEKFQFDEDVRRKKREELNINEGTIVLGHVGRFYKQKNHEYLINLLYRLTKLNNENDYKLLLIGIGPLQKKIKEKSEKMGIVDKVIFLNQRNDVNELMMAMDIFVLPSFYEGLPLVGVEAQKSGLFCLFSDSITKKLKISDNVKFIPLQNINKFVNEIANYNFKRCLTCSNEFEIKRCTSYLCELYFNLIEKECD